MKRKTLKLLSVCTFLSLSALSFNAFAGYVGNPVRPDTMVVPAHCSTPGCWSDAYYIKFLGPTSDSDFVWREASYDRNGNYIPAHWYYSKRIHFVNEEYPRS
jgi:hypothetical protein